MIRGFVSATYERTVLSPYPALTATGKEFMLFANPHFAQDYADYFPHRFDAPTLVSV